MQYSEQWIWLPRALFPNNQTTYFSALAKNDENANYTVVEFKRKYNFCKNIKSVKLRFSADTSFRLYCNNNIVATGPACVGGDFLFNETARDDFYAFETEIFPNSHVLDFFAEVRLMPVQICEYSKGQGGFYLFGLVEFADGTFEEIITDSDWVARINKSYVKPDFFDGRLTSEEFISAEIVNNIWNTETAPIKIRDEYAQPSSICCITVNANQKISRAIELDKIYAGFIQLKTISTTPIEIHVTIKETNDSLRSKELTVVLQNNSYRSFAVFSAGEILITATNNSNNDSEFEFSFISTHYPVFEDAAITTSDPDINLLLEVCKHTLKICRQTHHLDSPSHCEPLACIGDYYIESLMTLFSFGDMSLVEFDIIRIAKMLQKHEGRMFHTTYSLLFVKMLFDTYMHTGKIELLEKCKQALLSLLSLFDTYIGGNGLIENPPDYMFVDWIYIDGFSLHHPPKALGQTCLNCFYFGALDYASKIFKILNEHDFSKNYAHKKETLRKAINTHLFDKNKGVYFEGLNTPTDDSLVGKWMPQNTTKRYYFKHSNILACYFGICDDSTAKVLVDKIMSNEIEGDCQPYFLHYLLEAVFRLGLREKYTLQIINKWKDSIRTCAKGLIEGFYPPEPTYRFDHSHAWGGTPLYSLPKALLGLEIVKPGMKEIVLSPCLLGLDFANIELLTPYGKVVCSIDNNNTPKITHPKEITITVK